MSSGANTVKDLNEGHLTYRISVFEAGPQEQTAQVYLEETIQMIGRAGEEKSKKIFCAPVT